MKPSKFQFFTRLVLAAAADVGSGLLIALWMSGQQNHPRSIGLYVVAGLMGLSCDLDLLASGANHDDLLHKPILVIGFPIGIGLMFPAVGFWCFLWAACNTAHLVHDSIGDANSGGVAWLWPFYGKFFTFAFSNHLAHEHRRERAEVLPVYVHYRQTLVEALNTKDWLNFYYSRITLEVLFGVSTLTVGCMLALLSLGM